MENPTRVRYDCFSKTLLVTMHDTETNEISVQEKDPVEMPAITAQMDLLYPAPSFEWQFNVPHGPTQLEWVKAAIPN